MENIIKQLKRGAKDARLSTVEKATIKSHILHYVKLHPAGSVESSYVHASSSPFSIKNFRNKKTLSTFVIGGLLLGSSVSFASEGAVPGDLLYPVKIHINEQVRGAIAITPKAKAEWEVRLVERRLEEVEKLAISQNVPQEVQQAAQDNLATYTKQVEDRIAKFEDNEDGEDAIETASNLSDVLNAHELVLLVKNTNAEEASSATSTTEAMFPVVENEQISSTLKKVREARDDADKKHKELKEKYNKEKIAESEAVESINPTVSGVEIKESKNRANSGNNRRKQREDLKEEIRPTVNQEFPVIMRTSEPHEKNNKKEDKSQDTGRIATPKLNDGD